MTRALYIAARRAKIGRVLKNYLILLAGVFGSASSVFFIKDSTLPPATLAAGRTLLSALFLSPFALRSIRARGRGVSWDDLIVTLPGAALLAVHYATWFVGVRDTSAALSTLIINLIPILMPLYLFVLLRERINRGEMIGSAIAVAGVIVLTVRRDGSGQSTLHGVLFCIVSIALCGGYLAMGRRFGRGRNIFAYIVPLYAVAGLLNIGFAAALGERVHGFDARQAMILLGAVIFPTVIGHTAMNHAMVHLPAQVVSISNPLQFVFVAILAVPLRGEYPSATLALPAALVIAGAYVVIRAAPPRVAKEIERAATAPAGT